MQEEDTMMHVLGVATIHIFSLKKSLNKFGTQGEKEVTKELNQLHDMQTYLLCNPINSPRSRHQRHYDH